MLYYTVFVAYYNMMYNISICYNIVYSALRGIPYYSYNILCYYYYNNIVTIICVYYEQLLLRYRSIL